jgi:hypothetical protein
LRNGADVSYADDVRDEEGPSPGHLRLPRNSWVVALIAASYLIFSNLDKRLSKEISRTFDLTASPEKDYCLLRHRRKQSIA